MMTMLSQADHGLLEMDSGKPLILLLQGPVGPFFRDLARQLIDHGFGVLKINFNGGDLFYSDPANAYNFKGSPSEWSACLDELFTNLKPMAIVLFGDRRPYHIEALRVADEHGVTALCLEEGYVRPDYITCERNGNNARSPLRHAIPTRRAFSPAKPTISLKNSFGEMALHAAAYSVSEAVLSSRFRGNLRHRERPIAMECARWARSLIRKVLFHRSNRAIFNKITKRAFQHYYVVALQVHDDLSLTQNGNGWTMERLIDEVTRSFAENAPLHGRLLFKVHPLDRGHRPYRQLIAKAARGSNCAARVWVVDDCPIGPMIRNSNGVITVNSTSGLIALQHHKPLLVLGNAVYSKAALKTLPGLFPLDLHSFWRRPVVANEDEVNAFFDLMHSESLLNGSFYLAGMRQATCNAVIGKIQQEVLSTSVSHMLDLIQAHHSPANRAVHEQLAG